MKIDKEKVYLLKLSGHQIKLIEYAVGWTSTNNGFSEKGELIAESLIKDLEEVEEI